MKPESEQDRRLNGMHKHVLRELRIDAVTGKADLFSAADLAILEAGEDGC